MRVAFGPIRRPLARSAPFNPLPEGEANFVVEASDLYKTYVSGRLRVPALKGVNLRIERGEIVAIVGPSGCGKTTLLHCLSGLEDFEAGEVLLEGLSLAQLSDGQKADQRARRVGFVGTDSINIDAIYASGFSQKRHYAIEVK